MPASLQHIWATSGSLSGPSFASEWIPVLLVCLDGTVAHPHSGGQHVPNGLSSGVCAVSVWLRSWWKEVQA